MLLLPPKQKEVVILEFWYGMSISEISETLRISRRSVSERKKNAFANIRSYYERTQKHETGLCFSSMVQIEQVERLVVSFSCKTCHRITFPIWKMHGSL
ncbi:sigma factor-like helix-turn-helix DNA-binding protein [uncultured Ruminococcus sp.]|uniref:sigma factor-like helix-turn-helix DNA-binding protein n=1 Tax=uncultured Ruminococcus sp. TaxID=165186 RepID=UPI00261F661A|nr:sigma factor-like helix-turn-helix DNA-binding protein [uncultured Ruminococcus sp.]